MESNVMKGSCLCGSVKYEIYPPFLGFYYCHCPRCQKASAYVSNIFVSQEQFRWTSGEDTVARFDLPEAKSFSTCFCRVCGSPLPHLIRDGKEIVVPAGSLDDDPKVRPERSIWWGHKAVWFTDPNELPQFLEYPVDTSDQKKS